MNFANLTRDQNRYIQKEITKAILNFQEKLFEYGLDFDLIQILKTFLSFFMNHPEIREEGVLRTVLSMILSQRNQEYYIEGILNTIYGNNLAGKILLHQGKDIDNTYILMDFKSLNNILNLQQKKIYKLREKLFFEGFKKVQLENAINRIQHQSMKNHKFFTFLKKIKGHQVWRHCSSMVRKQMFDKEFLDKECKMLQEQEVKSYREQAIVSLYKKQLNKGQIDKYNCYQLITYLLTISDKKFEDDFGVYNEEDVYMLVKFLEDTNVNSLSDLRIKANIVKHVECNSIYFNFSDCFKLEDIPDDMIINMLESVENRLQIFYYGPPFVLIRRLSDNKVMRCKVTYDNKQQIESLFQQCNDDNVYDIIVRSDYKYENIQNIRMRYLNYNCNQSGPRFKLILNHPEDLVSLSTQYIKISNISKCTNIKNLCSQWNTYIKQDIEQLHNIKRLYSQSDEYYNEKSCLLEDLFKNNKPEYVYIKFGQKIQYSMLLKQNIENLKLFISDNIKLDISCYFNNVDRLYDLFLKKYVDQEEGYQDIDFYNKQWIAKQITRDQFIRYMHLTFIRNPFDPLDYKSRMMNIFLQDYTRQKQEKMLKQLLNDINEYQVIAQLATQQMFDIVDVNNLAQLKKHIIFINNSDNNDLKGKIIKLLCNELNRSIETDFRILQIMQQLIKIDDQTFKKEFYVDTDDDFKTLVHCLVYNSIENNRQLRQMLAICKYLDCKQIYMKFNDNFKLEDIPDDILVHLFDNITNRIQNISENLWNNFIIIHRVSDNKIFKSYIKHEINYDSDESDCTNDNYNYEEDNIRQIEEMLQQCNDNELYDVVIKSQNEFKNLKNIRIRYLNYVYDVYKKNTELTLSHPEDLMSLSTHQVKISNINQCTNLRNLYSYKNTYKSHDIVSLKNLRRINSEWDKYEQNDSCLLQDLFKNNKLKYVHVYNDKSGSNVINSFVIQDNIENLRYMFVDYYGNVHDIKLNVNQFSPQNLSVFYTDTRKNDEHIYGTIEGENCKVNKIKQSLIHQIKENV